MMLTHENEINRVNQEYSQLLHDIVKRDNIFNDQKISIQDIVRKLQNERFLVASEFGLVSSLQHKALNIYKEVNEFWNVRRDSYLKNIRNLEGVRLFLDYPDNRLLCAFESLLIPDPLYTKNRIPHPDLPGEVIDELLLKFTIDMIIAIKDAKSIIKYLCLDWDKPAILIYPIQSIEGPLFRDLEEIRKGKHKDPILQIAEDMCLTFFNTIKKVDLEFESTLHWRKIGGFGKYDVDIKKLFDVNEIAEFLDLESNAVANQVQSISVLREIKRILIGEVNIINGQMYTLILQMIFGLFYEIASKEYISFEMKSDPIFNSLSTYKKTLELRGSEIINHTPYSADAAKAKVLNLPDFTALDNFTLSEIGEMRHKESITLFRDLFYKHRNKLKYAEISDFEIVGKEVKNRLNELMIEHNMQLRKLQRDYFFNKRRINEQKTQPFGWLALNLISIGAPVLSALTVPASFIGLSKSLNECRLDEQINKKLIHEAIEKSRRPIAMIRRKENNSKS